MTIVDTNVVSEVMKQRPDEGVLTWLGANPLDNMAITAVTLAEIHYGLCRLPHGRRRRDLERSFRAFVDQGFAGRVLHFDAAAAEIYGDIVAQRERIGRPMDAFDAMIAAIARVHRANLATRNVDDFDYCGVELVNPWTA